MPSHSHRYARRARPCPASHPSYPSGGNVDDDVSPSPVPDGAVPIAPGDALVVDGRLPVESAPAPPADGSLTTVPSSGTGSSGGGGGTYSGGL
ncbi:MAG TPA: hypothetical protein PLH06_13210, partial [Candidatus Hydrogenedentes bacterium]|nr:hypothetical protein [Candidatus Hydrogenedentota bacterium]